MTNEKKINREYNQFLTDISRSQPLSDPISAFIKSTDVIFRLIAFFTLAVPFYHGGTVTLLEGLEENKMLIFTMMFFIAIILYFIGTNVDGIYAFASLVAILMVIDAIWCCCMKYELRDDKFATEWIQLNAITAGFFISFLLLPINLQGQDSIYISLTFFIVITLRTILDYKFGWNTVYSKAFPRTKSTVVIIAKERTAKIR